MKKQPLVTLHGHIHESTRLTGQWKQQTGKTVSFNAAHDGPELSIIKFDIENLQSAERTLYYTQWCLQQSVFFVQLVTTAPNAVAVERQKR